MPEHYERAPAYSSLQLEACLCVWEELLRCRRAPILQFEAQTALNRFWGEHGTAAMRMTHTPAIADWVLALYDATPENSRDVAPYDWEFVPACVAMIEWPGPGETLTLPAIDAELIERLAAMMSQAPR